MVSVAVKSWVSFRVEFGGDLSTELGRLIATRVEVPSQQPASDQGTGRLSGASAGRKVSPVSEEQQHSYLNFTQIS